MTAFAAAFAMGHAASALGAQASFSCPASACANCIAVILDAVFAASILIICAAICLLSVSLLGLVSLVLVSLVLAVLLITGQLNRRRRQRTA